MAMGSVRAEGAPFAPVPCVSSQADTSVGVRIWPLLDPLHSLFALLQL